MGDKTGIEWTDATWNPVTGCDKVSPGCDHCYAESVAHRFSGTEAYPDGFAVTLRPERLEQPLRWKRPRRIFVNSMSDLFHDQVPDEYIARVWAVMALAPRHTFQILTKRHGRMKSLVGSERFASLIYTAVNELLGQGNPPRVATDTVLSALDAFGHGKFTVLPNVHGGVSAEDQQRAALRIPALNATPFAVRFVSAEPLLGRIDLSRYLTGDCPSCGDDITEPPCGETHAVMALDDSAAGIDWVIVGGESGPGARPMHPDWARSLRDQCTEAGVAFLFKQRGEWSWNEPGQFRMPAEPFTARVAVMHGGGMTAMTKGNAFNPFERGHPFWATRIERVGKKMAGRELDGRTWDEFPAGVSV